MKNKRRLRDMALGSLLTMLALVLAVPALAQADGRTVQVAYDAIRLVVDGRTVTTKDGNGKQLRPVLIDGIAYLPAQAVSEALNMDLSWDNPTKTVTLTSRAGRVPDETGLIGVEKAKAIALEHAKVKASDAVFFKAALDWDDGRAEYEIEFYSGTMEYDYSIDPKTGAILSWDHEAEGYSIPPQNAANPAVTLERARALAQAKAPGAVLVSCKLEYDDGKLVYEGELRNGGTEYEFKIDAQTEKFLKWDVDYD